MKCMTRFSRMTVSLRCIFSHLLLKQSSICATLNLAHWLLLCWMMVSRWFDIGLTIARISLGLDLDDIFILLTMNSNWELFLCSKYY